MKTIEKNAHIKKITTADRSDTWVIAVSDNARLIYITNVPIVTTTGVSDQGALIRVRLER